MIRTLEQKLKYLAGNPVYLFVITHRKDDGTVEYTATLSNPEGICQVTCMYDNWFEATWYESLDEAESMIADSVRDIYSVERIRISRENLERGIKVTKEPPKAKFECTCGCEFEADLDSCRQTRSDLEGESRVYQSISFWSKCPACGEECADTRIK
ncbi:MAG: hypothetical protein IKA48_00425 [Fibrobacter sp.]|nr:hypothetical protein [Fibrobacter sp.]